MSDTCRIFPLFGDPWPSCLLPSQFQCVCPLMPSRNIYRLTWVSLTLDVGYLFPAAPAKRSHCSLPWTRGISSPPIKNLPAMQDTQVWSLGWEDPLEKEMATYSHIVVWRIPWTEEPGKLQSMVSQRVGHD